MFLFHKLKFYKALALELDENQNGMKNYLNLLIYVLLIIVLHTVWLVEQFSLFGLLLFKT